MTDFEKTMLARMDTLAQMVTEIKNIITPDPRLSFQDEWSEEAEIE